MSSIQKKLISALLICALLAAGAAAVGNASAPDHASGSTEQTSPSAAKPQQDHKKSQGYDQAKTDLLFWYEDDSYTSFFARAAERYYEETGIKVSAKRRETLDYMGEIYDKTMQDDAFPDVCLISGENLEEAYLYGLVSVHDSAGAYEKAAKNAVKAATYRDQMLSYPLSYNTALFVYNTEYFEKAPESLQAIIDYSIENEPEEHVEYLLEWDVNDAFYDFPFISNSVRFEKTETETMKIVYDEELYRKDMEFFENILISFSVDAETVTEQGIIENFKAGRTLCAILDSDSLKELKAGSCSLTEIPDLNEELEASSCATTDMLIVNAFSGKQEQAAAFAEFVTVTMAGELHQESGHYPVFLSEDADEMEQTAYSAYEDAVLVPNSQDAKDFWVGLEETISRYF